MFQGAPDIIQNFTLNAEEDSIRLYLLYLYENKKVNLPEPAFSCLYIYSFARLFKFGAGAKASLHYRDARIG